MMQPICVRYHVNIRPNTFVTSITSVRTNIGKIFNTFKLSSLCMVTKIRFSCHRSSNWNWIWLPQLSIATIHDRKVFGSSLNFFAIIWLKAAIDPMIKQKFGHCPNNFWALLEKFGHQLGWLKIFNCLDQSFWAMPELFWGASKFLELLDWWPLLIEWLSIFWAVPRNISVCPFCWANWKSRSLTVATKRATKIFLVVDYGNEKLATEFNVLVATTFTMIEWHYLRLPQTIFLGSSTSFWPRLTLH